MSFPLISCALFSTICIFCIMGQVMSSTVADHQQIIHSAIAAEHRIREDEIATTPTSILTLMATIQHTSSILDAETTNEKVIVTETGNPITDSTTYSPLKMITSVVTSISGYNPTTMIPITESTPNKADTKWIDEITTESTIELVPSSTSSPIPATTMNEPKEQILVTTSDPESISSTTTQSSLISTRRFTKKQMMKPMRTTTAMPKLSTAKTNQPSRVRLTISRPSTPATVPPIPKPAVQHSGKCTANGEVFPDPMSCFSFYSCYRKKAHKMYCGGTTVFNPSTNQCDWPQNVPFCNSLSG